MYTQKNLCHSRKEQKISLTRVKGLKLHPLFSFQVPEQNSILSTGHGGLTFILLYQYQYNIIVTIPESKRLPASEQVSLEHVQLCVQRDCCCILNTFQFFNGICKKTQEIANSEWYFVYEIIDLGFIPVNKSSFSTRKIKKLQLQTEFRFDLLIFKLSIPDFQTMKFYCGLQLVGLRFLS